jgi:hypothetical protein
MSHGRANYHKADLDVPIQCIPAINKGRMEYERKRRFLMSLQGYRINGQTLAENVLKRTASMLGTDAAISVGNTDRLSKHIPETGFQGKQRIRITYFGTESKAEYELRENKVHRHAFPCAQRNGPSAKQPMVWWCSGT